MAFDSSFSGAIVAKFATLAGGVWIEDVQDGGEDRTGAERCWRFDNAGRAEWCQLADLQADGDRCRWYGSQHTERDFALC